MTCAKALRGPPLAAALLLTTCVAPARAPGQVAGVDSDCADRYAKAGLPRGGRGASGGLAGLTGLDVAEAEPLIHAPLRSLHPKASGLSIQSQGSRLNVSSIAVPARQA